MSKKASIALPSGSEGKLLAFAAGLPAPAAKDGKERELPERLLVMPWGVTDTGKGRLVVNETTVAVLAHNQEVGKYDKVALDFSHNTVKATPGDEPVRVAGWGVPEIVPGEGIYLSAIEYTDHGREALLGGDYPDISPTVLPNEQGEVIFLDSVAAVRQGEVDGLVLFAPEGNKAATALAALSADGLVSLDADPDWKGIAIQALRAAGADLSEDADSKDVLLEAAKLSGPDKKKKDPKITMSAKPRTTTTSSGAAAEQSRATLSKVEQRLVVLESSQAQSERDLILAEAKREGKAVPLSAKRIAETEPEVLREIVDKLPADQVPLGSDTEGADDTKVSLSAGGISTADKKIGKMLGVSEDDLKKYA